VHVVEDEEDLGPVLDDVEHLHNVRMIDVRDDPRLGEEAPPGGSVRGERRSPASRRCSRRRVQSRPRAELGARGMGRVVLARHVKLGKPVAIKMLHAAYLREPKVVERFSREARAAAMLKSRHVVQVLDIDTANGEPFIVMEYLAGMDLADGACFTYALRGWPATRVTPKRRRRTGTGRLHRTTS